MIDQNSTQLSTRSSHAFAVLLPTSDKITVPKTRSQYSKEPHTSTIHMEKETVASKIPADLPQSSLEKTNKDDLAQGSLKYDSPEVGVDLLDYKLHNDGSVTCKLCQETVPSRTHWYRHKYKVWCKCL